MENESKRENYTIRLSKDETRRLEEKAEELKGTKATIIRLLIEEYLDFL